MKRIIAGLILVLIFCNFVFAADDYEISSGNTTINQDQPADSIEVSRLRADISVLRSEISDLKKQNEDLVHKSDVDSYRQDLLGLGYQIMHDFFMKLILVNMVFYIFILASLFVLKSRKML